MNTGFPRTFVINLDRAQERRESISKQLDALGIPFEFFRATDGRFFTENEQALYSHKETLKLLGYELTPNEVACAMSHIRVYEKMIQENIESALIFEDDAKIEDSLVQVLQNLSKFPDDWGLINLSSATYMYPTKIEVIPGVSIAEFRKPPKFLVAYLVTLETAKKLVELAYPIRCPADFLTGRAGLKYFKTYGVYPRVVGQVHEAGTDSNIGVRVHRPNLWWRIKRYLRLFVPVKFRNIPNLPDGTESKSMIFSLRNRYKRVL